MWSPFTACTGSLQKQTSPAHPIISLEGLPEQSPIRKQAIARSSADRVTWWMSGLAYCGVYPAQPRHNTSLRQQTRKILRWQRLATENQMSQYLVAFKDAKILRRLQQISSACKSCVKIMERASQFAADQQLTNHQVNKRMLVLIRRYGHQTLVPPLNGTIQPEACGDVLQLGSETVFTARKAVL